MEQQRMDQQRMDQQRMDQQRMEQQRMEQQRMDQQRMEQQRMEQHLARPNVLESKSSILMDQHITKPIEQFNDIKNTLKSMNININNDDTERYREMIMILKKENEKLKETIDNLSKEKNNEYEKLKEIKQQISKEFDLLKIKNEEIELKVNNFNLKELELITKESELKQLINNHQNLLKVQHLQMEVYNNENKSTYVWEMKPIHNVTSIKLVTYSLPLPRFNIESNKNNSLLLCINGEDKKITLPTGKYTIEDLISAINSLIGNENIKFSITTGQKILIEVFNDLSLELKSTLLLKNNLGFININEKKNKYIADNTWDLRIPDKVYLYLRNLSEDIPFGILYFNGNSVSQFKFEELFNLDKLEIVFKDLNGYDYNFYNLPHTLSFLIETIN